MLAGSTFKILKVIILAQNQLQGATIDRHPDRLCVSLSRTIRSGRQSPRPLHDIASFLTEVGVCQRVKRTSLLSSYVTGKVPHFGPPIVEQIKRASLPTHHPFFPRRPVHCGFPAMADQAWGGPTRLRCGVWAGSQCYSANSRTAHGQVGFVTFMWLSM
jgi:hypothetical protein